MFFFGFHGRAHGRPLGDEVEPIMRHWDTTGSMFVWCFLGGQEEDPILLSIFHIPGSKKM